MALTGRGRTCLDPRGELAAAALSSLGWAGACCWSVSWAACSRPREPLGQDRAALGCSLRHYRFNAPTSCDAR